jgi:hypothetical protein
MPRPRVPTGIRSFKMARGADQDHFKNAALQSVPCQSIPYRAVDILCAPAGPVALLWQVQCLHMRGILFL